MRRYSYRAVKKYGAITSLILAVFSLFHVNTAFADMASTNYQIKWDEFSAGGGFSSSPSYGLRDSAGASSAGSQSTSSSYRADSGFRAGVYDAVIGFAPYVQDSSTQVAAVSATSGPFNQVTVTTTAGFSVGDYVLIVQDEGGAQTSVMGQVTAVGGTTLDIRSNYAGTAPTIDGSNDYVYRMSPSASMGLGTLSILSPVLQTER
jgi:hypothetical protein